MILSGVIASSIHVVQQELPSQNLLLYSEDYSQSNWTKSSGVTVTLNNTTAPDSTTTGVLLTKSATGNFKAVSQQITSVIDTTYTFSAYVKLTTGTIASIALVATGNDVRYKYNLSDGVTITQHTSTGSSYVSSSMTNEGNGWFRVVLTAIAKGTNLKGFIYLGDLASTDINESIYAWGAQLVEGTVPRTYTKTTSTNVP